MEPLTAEEVHELESAIRATKAGEEEALRDFFTLRELRLVRNCVEYTFNDPAGLPGHNLMVLVAKMAQFHEWTNPSNWLDLVIEGMEESPPAD